MQLKKLVTLFIFLISMLTLSSCLIDSAVGNIAIVDSNNRTIIFEESPKKVVILQSSIGHAFKVAGGSFIGITSDYADYNLDGDNMTIVGTVKAPNQEIILSLNPDLIIYSDKIQAQLEIASNLESVGLKTYGVHIDSFEDYLFVLKQFTTLTNRPDLYNQEGLNVKNRIDRVKSMVKTDGPKVMFIRSFSTGYNILSTGNIVCSILDDLKCENIAGKNADLTQEISMEVVIRENPEYIFVVFMGQNNIETSKKYLEDNLYSNEYWNDIDAVKNDKLFYLPSDLFHFKPNNRWAESYEYIYNILYQEN